MSEKLKQNSPAPSFFEEKQYKGIFAYIFSTDHKRIGLLYFYSIAIFFVVGMLLGGLMKLELMSPGGQIMDPDTYNRMFTLHGVAMIFLVVIPGIPAVFGNFLLPLMIGAKDVAFPKLNLLSWWFYFIGGVFALLSLVLGGFPDTGWTFYAPYVFKSDSNILLPLLAAFILGFSSILTGLNFIVTMHRMRAKGMGWMKMPLFPWSLYGTGWIQLLATPVIGITLLMVIIEKYTGIVFFDPANGGDPVLYQHLFWIYAHPAVYIVILPAMGVISDIIPTFSQKSIFGYKAMIGSIMVIAFVGYFVWAHHMFTSGLSEASLIFFSFLTYIVAIPSAVKAFNWIATMYKGSIKLSPPFLWAVSFIFLFLIGGLTGLILGALATDVHLHDTQFVVAHFHFMVFGSTGTALIAAAHYWFPKMYGRMFNIKVANIAWGLFIIGFLTLYMPMFFLGFYGMPRRYYDYVDKYAGLNLLSTIGSWILITGLVIMIVNLVKAARKGKKADKNPWNGKTLEWTVPSPPPLENFEEDPVVKEGPYDY